MFHYNLFLEFSRKKKESKREKGNLQPWFNLWYSGIFLKIKALIFKPTLLSRSILIWFQDISWAVSLTTSRCYHLRGLAAILVGDKTFWPTILSGGKGLLHLTAHNSSWMEARAGTWRQKLKQRSQRNGAYWLALHSLLSLLSYIAQDCFLESVNGLGLSLLMVNQKNAL